MKKNVWVVGTLLVAITSLSSCATVEGWLYKEKESVNRVSASAVSQRQTNRDTDRNQARDRGRFTTQNDRDEDRIGSRPDSYNNRYRSDSNDDRRTSGTYNNRYRSTDDNQDSRNADRYDSDYSDRSSRSNNRYNQDRDSRSADNNYRDSDRDRSSNRSNDRDYNQSMNRNDDRYTNRDDYNNIDQNSSRRDQQNTGSANNDRYNSDRSSAMSGGTDSSGMNRQTEGSADRAYNQTDRGYGQTDMNRNRDMGMANRGDMNAGTNRMGASSRFESDRQDLMSQIDESITALDKQMEGMKGEVPNENRQARKMREDGQRDLQEKRRQLTDQAYKVQRTQESDFRQVRRETNRLIDDVQDSVDKLTKKAIDKVK